MVTIWTQLVLQKKNSEVPFYLLQSSVQYLAFSQVSSQQKGTVCIQIDRIAAKLDSFRKNSPCEFQSNPYYILLIPIQLIDSNINQQQISIVINFKMDHQAKTAWKLYSTPEKQQVPDLLNKNVNRTADSYDLRSSVREIQSRRSNIKQRSGIHHQPLYSSNQHFNNCRICSQAKSQDRHQHCHVQKIHFECKCAEKYETQIKDLEFYLQRNSQLDKTQILRIFGLGYDYESREFMSEQQLMLKQLSKKVQVLIKQNSRLKQTPKKIPQCQRCQSLLVQNQRYKRVLQEYKNAEISNTQQLINQNRRLSQKLIQCENALRNCQKQLRKAQSEVKTRVQYIQIEKKHQPINLQIHKSMLNAQLSDFYKTIEFKNDNLNHKLKSVEQRIQNAEQSISHMKFERQVKIQHTLRKSKNFAQFSRQTVGDNQVPVAAQFQQFRTVSSRSPQPNRFIVNQRPVSQNQRNHSVQSVIIRSDHSERVRVLQQRNLQLFRQTEALGHHLRNQQATINQKVQRILILQNQLNKNQSIIAFLNSKINQMQNTVVTKVIKKRDYSSDVKNIKQFLVSCNPSNFDKFQQQFKEIIQQRNQLFEQVQKFKVLKFDRQQYLANQRALSQSNKRVQQLQLRNQNLSREVKMLSQRCEKLERQNENFQANDIISEIEGLNNIKRCVPEGKNGLQWQKIVRRCVQETANKLIGLQGEMRYEENGEVRQVRVVREVREVRESREDRQVSRANQSREVRDNKMKEL